MTAVVGIAEGGYVWIGADSAGTAGWAQTIRADVKVFKIGPYVMGFTDSFRMGQLLHYALEAPDPSDTSDLDGFMVTAFVDAVRHCLREGGWLEVTKDREYAGQFLVGIRGHLYCIDSDLQIGRPVDDYMAVGCGQDLALGSLHSTSGQPRTRIKTALEAAAYHSAGVAGPFLIERSPR